jgi:hypothetical protein
MQKSIKERVATRRKGKIKRGKRQAIIASADAEEDDDSDADATIVDAGGYDSDATMIGNITPPTGAAFADKEVVITGENRKPAPGSQERVNYDILQAQARGAYVDLV